MKKTRVKILGIEEDSVLKERKIYVPKDKELKTKITQLHHDVSVAECNGRWKITDLVMRNYWWLGVNKEVRKYVDNCDLYQRMKNRMKMPAGKLMANKVPKKLWTHLMVDFIIKLPLVAEKDTILIVYDRLFKVTHFVTTIEGIAN